jgi:hypothetical protein
MTGKMTNTIKEMEIRTYAVPFNDRGMKRAIEIEVYDGDNKESFLAHQTSDKEILIPGELENTKPKLEGKPGKLVYLIKDKEFSDDVRNTVKLKAEYKFAGKEAKFW